MPSYGKNRDRQYTLPTMGLAEMEEEAIEFIRKHEPDTEKGYYVGFSGGKDSIVTLDLVKRSGVKFYAGYNVTGIDPKPLVQFIKKNYPEVKFRTPKKSFWRIMRKKGPPLRILRWCCQEIKETEKDKHNIFGLRAEESVKRAALPRVDIMKSRGKGKRIYKPIFHWQEWAVWEYIEKYHLPYPDLYDKGHKRLGCLGCPFALTGASPAKAKARERERREYPLFYKIHEKIAREWYASQADHPRNQGRTFEEFYERYWTT